MKKIIILDTETTGLPANPNAPYTDVENWPRLVSIAWRVYNSEGELLRKKHFYIEPGKGVVSSPEALEKHGITHDFAIENGIKAVEALNRIVAEYFPIQNGKRVVTADFVAHNAAYDKNVIYAEMHRIGWEPPEANWLCTKECGVELCKIPVSEAARARYPDAKYKWPSLDELYYHLFGEAIPGRETHHGASQDAAACAACFWEMVKLGIIKI